MLGAKINYEIPCYLKNFIYKLFIICSLIINFEANAKDFTGTIYTKSSEMTNGGELRGCQIEFLNYHFDNIYSPFGMVAVGGSISIALSPKGGTYGLKVVVLDQKIDQGGVKFLPNRPFEINMANKTGISTYGVKREIIEAETDGAAMVAFPFSDKIMNNIIEKVIDEKGVSIIFNRKKNGADLSIPVDFTVIDTDSSGKKTINNSTLLGYMNCSLKLLSKVKSQLK